MHKHAGKTVMVVIIPTTMKHVTWYHARVPTLDDNLCIWNTLYTHIKPRKEMS